MIKRVECVVVHTDHYFHVIGRCAIYGIIVSLVCDKSEGDCCSPSLGARLSDVTRLPARGLLTQLLTALAFFGPVTFISLNALLRMFIYATRFSWLDPLCLMMYCFVIIIALCVLHALRLHRSDFIAVLKGRGNGWKKVPTTPIKNSL